MENLLIILRHTPYWVWIVLGYLIYAGVKASQPRQQSLVRMLVVPMIFMAWGISAIFHTLQLPLAAAGENVRRLSAGITCFSAYRFVVAVGLNAADVLFSFLFFRPTGSVSRVGT
ncbi:DUF6622 family protein [Pectobacterium sp. CHL-2024]|uniref:DUF6622 family protein n=1 Tax=Pectobacterium sp. CHL-2024 TaxID=3377079 RepID=UPI00382E3108